MSNIKSNLVFDFPDPSPHFDFEDVSPKSKSKLKGSRGFGKFKSHRSNKPSASASNSGNHSPTSVTPDKSTATTAASSFDESAFDEFDDEMFDFGLSKQSKNKTSTPNKSSHPRGNHSPSARRSSPPQPNVSRSSPQQQSSPGGSTNYELTPSKPSFEFTDHKPLKLPSSNNSPYASFNNRSPSTSNRSTSGYISEVSEFSFDRVTVNTTETPMTGMSSNVSWNFFDKDLVGSLAYSGENSGLNNGPSTGYTAAGGGNSPVVVSDKKGLGFEPYTGDRNKRRHPNQSTSRTQIKINMDNIDLDNELPISGIVDSNQSVVSEISDMNDGDEDIMNEAVRMHLANGGDAAAGQGDDDSRNKTPSPRMSKEDKSKQSIMKDFRDYTIRKQQSEDQAKRYRGDAGGKSTKSDKKKQEKNVYGAFVGNICAGLDFCSFYLCGADTTDGTFGSLDFLISIMPSVL